MKLGPPYIVKLDNYCSLCGSVCKHEMEVMFFP